jgi:type II secretory ATPase GspE/PulE/Tfp pilus assembly ATPase PilB-like protein
MLKISNEPSTASQDLISLGFTANNIKHIRDMFAQHDTCRRIVLVSGQSGSGKSTTVKHVAEYLLACQPSLNILGVEYNPEYPINGVAQILVKNIADYAQVISSAARLDPDVVVVGEIRDAATALAVLMLAESGHTVITSINARSQYEATQRFDNLAKGYEGDIPETESYTQMLLNGSIHQDLDMVDGQFKLKVAVESHTFPPEYEISGFSNRVAANAESLTKLLDASCPDFEIAYSPDTHRLTKLGFTDSQARDILAMFDKNGLILVGGATNSGRSTTVKNIIESLLAEQELDIVSVEQHPDYTVDGVGYLRFDETDENPTVAEAIKLTMRRKPNILMVGEIRSADMAEAILDALESGITVITEIHSNPSLPALAMTRFTDYCEKVRSFNAVRGFLAGVIVQKLVKTPDLGFAVTYERTLVADVISTGFDRSLHKKG